MKFSAVAFLALTLAGCGHTDGAAGGDLRQSGSTSGPVPAATPATAESSGSEALTANTPTQNSALPPAVTIAALRYSGTGCPKNSAAVNVSPDHEAFTLIMSKFTATATGKKPVTLGCRVALVLTTTPGWQVSVLTIDWRGFADIQKGGFAELSTGFSFSPYGLRSLAFHRITGPVSDNFEKRAASTILTGGWSGCETKKTLYVDLDTALFAGGGTNNAELDVDSIDGQMQHKAGLTWRRCTGRWN